MQLSSAFPLFTWRCLLASHSSAFKLNVVLLGKLPLNIENKLNSSLNPCASTTPYPFIACLALYWFAGFCVVHWPSLECKFHANWDQICFCSIPSALHIACHILNRCLMRIWKKWTQWAYFGKLTGYNFVSVAFLFSLSLERAVFFFISQTCSNLQLLIVLFFCFFFLIRTFLRYLKHYQV